ncbi:interleukin 17 receptor A1a [Sardina pilchardus]|uniref:interleukin 17 receptor A1a n=1 Tax=Sardina pilchardus TaxID=27697 RepID=UPI002E0F8036
MVSVSWGSVLLTLISGISGLRILNQSSLSCTQPELRCRVVQNNCLEEGWLKERRYTPSSPRDLEVSVDVRKDENGDFQPVLVAHWKASDDGSIRYLNGTMLDVLHSGTNYHFCLKYIFLDKFTDMRKHNGEQWSFSTDQVILDPAVEYLVTVHNLPRPNLGYTSYHINKSVRVPDCTNVKIRKTKACLDSGYHWQPNVTWSKEGSSPGTLTVSFNTGELADRYRVTVKCKADRETQELKNSNTISLSAVYNLGQFPSTCCDFDVQIQPFFPSCSNDCVRMTRFINICPAQPTVPPDKDPKPAMTFIIGIIAGLLFVFAIACCFALVFLHCRKSQKGKVLPLPAITEALKPAPRTVLIIYSQDHKLYTNIVLKLCAFLRAKCATDVVMDQLDSAWLGTVGRLPWLEQQRRRIDKVLILCSRGVRAKWDAMCGQPAVTLAEDLLSPTDDMTTAALNLMLPDLQRAASLGKYLVAYFDEVSSERDVPSVFGLGVKYRLMKQFEEFFFRIQDMEKYQPDRVNTIEGIASDDYFGCPSGQELKQAIEAFRAYQLDNPDWFEKECVSDEQEAIDERKPLIDPSLYPPILKCEPLLNEGLPVLLNEVDVRPVDHPAQCVLQLTPEINHSAVGATVQELDLRNLPGNQPLVHLAHPEARPRAAEDASHLVSHNEPRPREKPVLREVRVDGEPLRNEEAPTSARASYNTPSLQALQQLLALQQCLTPLDVPVPSVLRAQPEAQPVLGGSPSQAVEMAEEDKVYEYEEEEAEVMEVAVVENAVVGSESLVAAGAEEEEDSGKRQSRGSDQGYGSRETPITDPPPASSLMALAALQQSLFMASPRTSGFGSETAPSSDGQQYSPSDECVFRS